jgi:hypothetical protein
VRRVGEGVKSTGWKRSILEREEAERSRSMMLMPWKAHCEKV